MNPNGREWEINYLLLHIAVACPKDAEELAKRTTYPKELVHEELKKLLDEGVVHVHQGYLRALTAQKIISEASQSELRDVQQQVLNELDRDVPQRTMALIALAESGCCDEKLLDLLISAVSQKPADEALLKSLETVAAKNQLSPEELTIMQAEDAAWKGLGDQVLNLTDKLLTAESETIYIPAALVAAGAHIQANRLQRAEALFEHVGTKNISYAGVWAVIAALGTGDLEAAQIWRDAMGVNNLTNSDSGLSDLADGLLLSIAGDGEDALNLLARSVSTLSLISDEIILPETPAALAALVAIGRGEPRAAQIILEKALKTALGGEAGRRRHTLLHAWSLMVQGHLDIAEKNIVEFKKIKNLCDRDQLLYGCILVGLARRRTDIAAMREAWETLRGQTFGMDLTLYDLLPLGEMLVTAARLRDFERIQPFLKNALSILQNLNDPIAWSAPLHWHAVQAAFQVEDPSALIPHANALVKAEKVSSYAATLAQAGNTWLEVLRREANFASVTKSVRALAKSGQVWDAARLAGQAALQHPEREEALSMMQLAREVNKEQLNKASTLSKSSVLTARELEVGRLVLDGQGYRAIGEQLFISPKTVEHHVARIRNRLGASSRGELIEKLHDVVNS